jgi:hypothetical protein
VLARLARAAHTHTRRPATRSPARGFSPDAVRSALKSAAGKQRALDVRLALARPASPESSGRLPGLSLSSTGGAFATPRMLAPLAVSPIAAKGSAVAVRAPLVEAPRSPPPLVVAAVASPAASPRSLAPSPPPLLLTVEAAEAALAESEAALASSGGYSPARRWLRGGMTTWAPSPMFSGR